MKNTRFMSVFDSRVSLRRHVAVATALAVSTGILVAPENTGLIPAAHAGIYCDNPQPPLAAAKAEGFMASPSNWNQGVITSTDKSEVFPGDTFTYRVQIMSTYSSTSIGRVAISLPPGLTAIKISNPYTETSGCGFTNFTHGAYPEYKGDKSRVWSAGTTNPSTANGSYRQVDFTIQVDEDAEVNTTATIGLGLQVGGTLAWHKYETTENPTFGPSVHINERRTGLALGGDAVVSATDLATVEATVAPLQAEGLVFFSVEGSDTETPVEVNNGKAIWKVASPDGNDFTVKARFVSNNGFANAETVTRTITVVKSQAQITLDHPLNAQPNEPVELHAQVTPRNVSGKIKFTWTTGNKSETYTKEMHPDENGEGRFQVTFPGPGVESITAQLVPDDENSPYGESAVKYSEINIGGVPGSQKAQTTSTVDVSTSGQVGQPLTINSTVTPSEAEGSMEFYVGGAKVGTVAPESNGQASFTWTPKIAGTYKVKTKFAPSDSSGHLPSESNYTYVTVAPKQAAIKKLTVASQSTLLEKVRVSASMEQPDARGFIRFYLGRNPNTDPQPVDDNDLTIVDVPVVDTVATTTEAKFDLTGDQVPVYAVFIPESGSGYSRSEPAIAYSKVVTPPKKDPKEGAVALENISLNFTTLDKIYHAGDEIQVAVHLENNEPITGGFTHVNEIGLYAPKGFKFVSVDGDGDVSGSIKQSESLIDKKHPRFTGFKLKSSSVPSNSFPASGYRDFIVTYRVTDDAVSGKPNYFQTALNLYGGGDSDEEGGVSTTGQAIQAVTGALGPFLGNTWGNIIKAGGTIAGGLLKGRNRTNVGPRTADKMPITVEGTHGTGDPNDPIGDLNPDKGSSKLPEWAQILIGVLSSLGLLLGGIAAAVHFLPPIQLPF